VSLLQSLFGKLRRRSSRQPRTASLRARARLTVERLEARDVPSGFSIVDLGTFGGANSYAFGISEVGQVVGTAQNAAGVNRAFLWDDGVLIDLGTPNAGTARGINQAGQVVGVNVASQGEASTSSAFFWEDGALDLFTSLASASAINDSGATVGQRQATSGSPSHAFLYQNGTLTDLGTLGGAISQATAINSDGQVAGASQVSGSPLFHALVWQNGTMTDLGQLGSEPETSFAAGINDAGVVVGYSGNAAFVYDATGMRDLQVPTLYSAAAYDINNAGQIVGASSTYAFLADASGTVTDLNSLIPTGTDWSLTSATAINDAGQIVGVGWRGGVQHAFLLNPTPTAATVSLWDDSATPGGQISDGPVELGVRFQADVSGFITGIRFHKGEQNTGTHVGNLWSESGELLATATFANETASGWQLVTFDAPVAIQAGTNYIASYHTDAGYAYDHYYFAEHAETNGPLTATAGVYAYGQGGFPTETYRSSNYWVDVMFAPSTPPPTPAGAQAIGGSSGRVTVAWLASPGATSYNFYRSTVQGGQGSVPYQTGVVGDPLNGFLTFVDTAVANGTTYYYQISAVNDSGESAPSNEVGATPIGPVGGSGFSLFDPLLTPTVAAANDSNAVELGVRFYSDVDGFITGIRFYRGVAIDSGYTVNLWSEHGTLLTTANVVEGQSPSPGWQQVSFAPVAITAGTTYVASYFASTGQYAFDGGYFAESGVGRGPLHAEAGNNGVYHYGSEGGFPDQTYQSSNYWVDVVFQPAATHFSLWDDTTTPTNAAALDDTNPVEVGVKFRSDSAGFISAIRFYRGVAIDSGYTVHLWSEDGTLLAVGTVIEGQSSTPGWQEVSFPSVAIAAGTTYIASYYASNGQYAYDHDYFAGSGVANGPLQALSDGVDGGNGVYLYQNGGGFPTQTYRSSNYWVDVVFQTQL
jgi:probable HAF family extracellular repeat protein